MIKYYLSVVAFSFFLFSCGDKKAKNQADHQEVEKIENQNQEMKTLENSIEQDVKDIDDLLKEVEN